MADRSTGIARQYTIGGLLDGFRQGLQAAGHDPDNLTPEALYGGDEFHIGGAEATEALVDRLELHSGMHVLDVGAGVGGPARLIAQRCDCRVTGVDLTSEFVETGQELTRMVGLSDRVRLVVGSGTDLPLGDGEVDAATMLHVGMNIADKKALFAQVWRVLKPGGVFGVYDVMEGAEPGPLTFPLPWAKTQDASFVSGPADYRAAARDAGFRLGHERDRWQYGYDFMREMMARAKAEGPPPLGPHLFMGEGAPVRLGNAVEMLAAKRLSPVEMIFEKPV